MPEMKITFPLPVYQDKAPCDDCIYDAEHQIVTQCQTAKYAILLTYIINSYNRLKGIEENVKKAKRIIANRAQDPTLSYWAREFCREMLEALEGK